MLLLLGLCISFSSTLELQALGPKADSLADHWAVLVAGSKGFYNYRHQSDVCHAYHLMVK